MPTSLNRTLDKMKWEVRQRLTLLEALAFWRGEFSASDLIGVFGIARSQASKDLASYQRLFPGNLAYDRIIRRYIPTEKFRPGLIQGTPEELLRLTRASVHQQAGAVLLKFPSVALVEGVERKVRFDVLRRVNTAIRRRQVLRFDYQSMSSESSTERILAPHSLVHNGYRWHVRGFSHSHRAYRDFVLSRFLNCSEVTGDLPYRDADADDDWNRHITVKIAPHPGLTQPQQALIAEDFGMRDGCLEITTRPALLGYLLRVMGLATAPPKEDARAQQITLSNREELLPYLW